MPEEMWAVTNWSRLAELVRVRIAEFRADSFPELALRLERLPWAAYFPRPSPVPTVSCTSHMSALYHTGAVSERVLMVLGGKGIIKATRPSFPFNTPAIKRESCCRPALGVRG